jgi:hypothetical protein
MVVECTVYNVHPREFSNREFALNHREALLPLKVVILFSTKHYVSCVFVTNLDISGDQIIQISLFGCGSKKEIATLYIRLLCSTIPYRFHPVDTRKKCFKCLKYNITFQVYSFQRDLLPKNGSEEKGAPQE